MININADLYNDQNSNQKSDANRFIAICKKKLGWNDLSRDIVMDLGCGTGNSSTEVLLSHFPNVGKIIATDGCEDMIRLATERNSNPKVEYFVADVQEECIHWRWFGMASKVISMFCLHWAKKQINAFRNVYKLLKPGGEACLLFPLSAPNHRAYDHVKQLPKWKDILKGVSSGSPESQSKNLNASHYYKVFLDIGFDVILCATETKSYIFHNDDSYRKFLSSLCPLLKHIPDDMKDEFEEDLLNSAWIFSKRYPDGLTDFRFPALMAILRKPT